MGFKVPQHWGILGAKISIHDRAKYSWIKTLRDRQPPSLELSQVQILSWMIRGELIGLVLIPLFATLLARGF
jgi:uncharacterized membrane protein